MYYFDIMILGRGGVGKTSYLRRFSDGHFVEDTSHFNKHEYYKLIFNTNYGKVYLKCWSNPDKKSLAEASFRGYIDAGIIMFDLTNIEFSEKEYLPAYFNYINTEFGKMPLVLVGNKCELVDEEQITKINFHRKKGLQFYQISAKTMYNYDKPIFLLNKKISWKRGFGI